MIGSHAINLFFFCRMATVVGTYNNLGVDFYYEMDVALLSIEFYIHEAS